jgi:serine O-acetyltransferase
MSSNKIVETIENILAKDPAAHSRLEIVLCYPGFHAVTVHLLAHALWKMKLRTLARFISHLSRIVTGIEIHPGATIGHRLFIDHGMGVVIGETAVIGNDVTIYQGVTLGAGAAARMGAQSRGIKRHPTLADGVVVGSNAEVQGDILVGQNARVASGSIVLKNVPENSVVVGVPARVIYQNGEKKADETIDMEAEAIRSLKNSITSLNTRLSQLDEKLMISKGHSAAAPATSNVSQKSERTEAEPENQDAMTDDPVDLLLYGAGI